LMNRGRAMARGGDVKGAIAEFREAQKLSSDIQVPTEEEVKWWAARGLANKGEKLVKEGKVQEAIDAYSKARKLKPNWYLEADSWDILCRYGSLHGEATKVMEACDNALRRAPGNIEFRDSRGIARALTRDKQGAIEDFQAFIKSTDSEEKIKQRQGWIEALKAGENPFTEEVLEELKE
ncbi:MAG: hypothetical protein WA919_09570, partial [Coleofasciculaceae cyanobacterium]